MLHSRTGKTRCPGAVLRQIWPRGRCSGEAKPKKGSRTPEMTSISHQGVISTISRLAGVYFLQFRTPDAETSHTGFPEKVRNGYRKTQ
jgi:hypothetical protein